MLPDATATFRLDGPLHFGRTLGPVRRGRFDPAMTLTETECWRASRTPEGPSTTNLRLRGSCLEVEAWGPGATWAVDHVPELVGLCDPGGFDPCAGLARELHRRLPGLRVGRTNAVAEALVPTIIEQKVTGLEAKRSYRAIVAQLGEPAPGPAEVGLRVPPAPATLAATPSWVFHRMELERKRADTITRAMSRASRLEETTTMSMPDAYRRLQAFPGVGAWSAAEVATVALGDPDAVSVGDYHLSHQVTFAFTGERAGSDERMLELLEPYAGHRGRVCRLIVAAGIRPPRHGPRMAPRGLARH